MSDIPALRYSLLWEERQVVSVANLTRQDDTDFLSRVPDMGIVVETTRYPLRQANAALADLRAGRFSAPPFWCRDPHAIRAKSTGDIAGQGRR